MTSGMSSIVEAAVLLFLGPDFRCSSLLFLGTGTRLYSNRKLPSKSRLTRPDGFGALVLRMVSVFDLGVPKCEGGELALLETTDCRESSI